MDKIKSLFIAIGITLVGIGVVLLIPILIAIASVVLTAVGIISCIAIVFILVDDENNTIATVHKEDEDT